MRRDTIDLWKPWPLSPEYCRMPFDKHTSRLVTGAAQLGLVLGLAATIIIPSQRKLTVMAQVDIPVLDVHDRKTVVGILRKGQAAPILRCEDNKHTIDPIVELSAGQVGELGVGAFEVNTEKTGILSRPQFLGCGNR